MDFQISNPSHNVWLLNESGAVTLFLVTGEERAVLIDTGFDQGALPDLVRSLTPLPVTLIHSHADLDHIVGDAFWDEAWIHPADMPALRAQPYGERMTLHELHDGDVIDLGGRALEVIFAPGHTPGNCMFLDRGNRILFSCDTLMDDTVPINKYETGIADFYQTMLKAEGLLDAVDVIYPAHGTTPFPKEAFRDLKECARLAFEHVEPEDIYYATLIAPDRSEMKIKHRGYQRGKCSVSLEFLEFIPQG